MTQLEYRIVEWSDRKFSFEEVDPETGGVIFRSHTAGYPPSPTLDDTLHAIEICETARAKRHGCAPDDLESWCVFVKRPATARRREAARAEARMQALAEKYHHNYTRHPLWEITEAVMPHNAAT